MAAELQPGGALSNRRARRRSRVPMSEINVTPMVDVMLVLLIIFMVTAPLLTVPVDVGADAGLPAVELPATEAGAAAPEQRALNITVDADGRIFLEDSEISSADLVPKLTAIRDAFGARYVWVRGDSATAYGRVAGVLVRIKEAGLPVILVTDQTDQP